MYNFRINSANSVINVASYLAVVTSGIFLLGASGVQAQTAKYTAKIAHLEQATQPRHQGLERVAALVKERTKGEVEFKLYPSSQLGNARQMTGSRGILFSGVIGGDANIWSAEGGFWTGAAAWRGCRRRHRRFARFIRHLCVAAQVRPAGHV